MTRNVLIVDNHDSFTFNIVEALERLGASVRTVRNEIAAENALEQARQANAMILISPGPGRPEEAGCSMALVRLAKGKVPLFGVCLGHQAMVLEAGGEVVRAPEPVAFAEELAAAARRETLDRWASGCAVEDKGSGDFDPVTQADREAERVMRALIRERYPDHAITGEEWPDEPGASAYRWSLD